MAKNFTYKLCLRLKVRYLQIMLYAQITQIHRQLRHLFLQVKVLLGHSILLGLELGQLGLLIGNLLVQILNSVS